MCDLLQMEQSEENKFVQFEVFEHQEEDDEVCTIVYRRNYRIGLFYDWVYIYMSLVRVL